MSQITIKTGEKRTLSFRIQGPTVAQIAAAAFQFTIKADKDDITPLVHKIPSDFDATEASNRIIKVTLSTLDTMQEPGQYPAELSMKIASDGDEPRSDDIIIIFKQSVQPAMTPQDTYHELDSDEVTLTT